MLCEPKSQFGLCDFASSKAQEDQASFFRACGYGTPIEFEENKGNLHGCSLVPVYKGMIC